MEEVDRNEVEAEEDEEERSTHFLAIRVTSPELVANLRRVQESIEAHDSWHEPIMRQCCTKPGLFHLTIGELRVQGPDGLVAMMVMMEGLRPVVEEMFYDQDAAALEIDGIGNFEQRVVYAKVNFHF